MVPICEVCHVIEHMTEENTALWKKLEEEREARHRAEEETQVLRRRLADRDLDAYERSIT